MWRTPKCKVFARWSLCNSRKLKKNVSEEVKNNNKLSMCLYENDHKDSSEKRETCHDDRKFFSNNCHISFLETIGWVGTAITIGLNFQLHSKRNRVVQDSWQGQCSSAPSTGLCHVLHGFLLRFVMAMPGQNLGAKSILPKDDSHKYFKTEEQQEQEAEKKNDSDDETLSEIASVTSEFIGHTENLRGVVIASKNIDNAFRCFEKAQALGSVRAHYNLGVCYETGAGTQVDFNKAAFHYSKAADAGHGLASYNLGIFYLEGRGGLQQDPFQALNLIQKAAEKDVSEALLYMGRHYLEETEFDKAIDYLKRGVNKQDTDAYYHLGLCYENGWGVPSNNTAAAEFYSFAASHGHEEASEALKILEVHQDGLEKENKPFAESTCGSENGLLCRQGARDCDNSKENSTHSSLHHSASSPELSREGVFTFARKDLNISKYLDLILPNIFSSPKKTAFHIEPKEYECEEVPVLEKMTLRNEVVAAT